ncbi:MAG: radical SAM family heme chaperone HemW [Terriglobia bacterium]
MPWCVRKCPYCDFNSHVAPAEAPFTDYLTALLRDLDFELEERPLDAAPVTLFFGGGTPSLLPATVLSELIEGIRLRTGQGAEAEITLEANPGTVERGRFAEYAAAGINRISLGAQSFDDALLRRIGRIHSAAETGQAIDELAAAGIGNFNLDVMYGLPGQTAVSALDDLEQAIAHKPAHVSWYELTLEPGTAFYRRPPRLPPEEDMLKMEAAGRELLAVAGFERYEISAYARDGMRCRHNENYWGYGDYLGVGPGAHGKRSHGGRIWRSERILSPARWLRQAGTAEAVTLSEVACRERPFEYVLNALRCIHGFDWPAFEERTGLPREAITGLVTMAVADGLLETLGDRVWPSARGLRYLNDLQTRFLPD